MKKITSLILFLGLTLTSLVGCNKVNEATLFNISKPIAYSYDIEEYKTIKHELNIDKINEENLLNELKKLNTISKEVSVIDFTINDKEENKKVGILNLSKDILNMNLGSGSEYLMIESLSKTFIENFNLDELVIKVENKNYESGHMEISEENPIKR